MSRRIYSFACNGCQCDFPLVMNLAGHKYIPVFRSKELAQIAASEIRDIKGQTPDIIEVDIEVIKKV